MNKSSKKSSVNQISLQVDAVAAAGVHTKPLKRQKQSKKQKDMEEAIQKWTGGSKTLNKAVETSSSSDPENELKESPMTTAKIEIANPSSILDDEKYRFSDISMEMENKNSYQKIDGRTIFVRGYFRNREEEEVRNALKDHFGSCGEITRIFLPKTFAGYVRGFAFIDFKDANSFNQALKLNNSKFYGSHLRAKDARQIEDDDCGMGDPSPLHPVRLCDHSKRLFLQGRR